MEKSPMKKEKRYLALIACYPPQKEGEKEEEWVGKIYKVTAIVKATGPKGAVKKLRETFRKEFLEGGTFQSALEPATQMSLLSLVDFDEMEGDAQFVTVGGVVMERDAGQYHLKLGVNTDTPSGFIPNRNPTCIYASSTLEEEYSGAIGIEPFVILPDIRRGGASGEVR